jgi:lipopolysaccharide export system protein LptA
VTGVRCHQPHTRIQNWLVVGLIALVGALPPAAQAEKADRQAPTNIDSDKLDHDDKTKRTIFTGNVVLTKGSLILRGDRLELQQLPDGKAQAVITGQPARFRQKREAVAEWMEGEGAQIDYSDQTEIAILTGNAVMRRVGPDKELDRVAGDRLRYNNVTEFYEVEIKPGQPRARMTLMPREAQP